MNIPPDCADWRRAMLGSCATRRILRRMEQEECLAQTTVDAFFDELTADLVRNPMPAAGTMRVYATWAGERVAQCLQTVAATVLAAGAAVPLANFTTLARIRPA